MSRLIVQVQRGDEWRNVTSVAIEDRRYDPDRVKARAAAFAEARRHLTAWGSYDGFTGMPMRIAEQAGYYGQVVEARP